MNLILAIDQGTTGTTAALYDVSNLNSRALSKVEFPQYFPEPGWVEHDPDEIITSVRQAIREVLAKVPAATIQAIGISNQRETVVAWHRESGALAGRAIVWQDRRTAAFCEGLKQKDKTRAVLEEHTGLVCDPYFSASKIRWILEHQPPSQRSGLRRESWP
jgi:glycerol kinase